MVKLKDILVWLGPTMTVAMIAMIQKFLDAIASQEETYVSRCVITFKINIPNQPNPTKPNQTQPNQTKPNQTQQNPNPPSTPLAVITPSERSELGVITKKLI